MTRSYHAVGVDELCAAADVRKGSFYHYFPAKAELAKAVIDLHAQAFWARLDDKQDATPLERLHAAASAIGAIQMGLDSRFGRAAGCPFGNLAAELATKLSDDARTAAPADGASADDPSPRPASASDLGALVWELARERPDSA